MGRIAPAPPDHLQAQQQEQHCDEACSELSSITEHPEQRSRVSSCPQTTTAKQQSQPPETFQDEPQTNDPPLPTEVLLPREKMAVLGISRTDYYEGDGTTMEETTSSYYNYGQHKLPYYTPRCFIHGALLPPWIRRSPGWLQCLLLGCLFIFLAAALIIFASVAWQIREGEESASSAQQQQRDQAWRNNNIVLATPAPSSLLQLPAEVTVVPTVVPSAFPSFEPSRGPSGIPSRVPSGTPSEAPSLVPSEQPTASFTDVPSVSLEPSQSFEPTHRPSVSMAPSLSWEPTGSFTQLAASSNMPTSVFGQQTTTTSIPTMLPSLAPSSPPTAMPTSIPSSAPSESQRVMMGGGGMGMRDSESSSLRPRRTAFPTFAPRGVNTR
mmetsp:Transcript_10584/g.20383  ORF Transcript_10584/g.20383 Transcript_10584/m.20383 type:complete len:381 (-) Transcript_10584:416-1558(-)